MDTKEPIRVTMKGNGNISYRETQTWEVNAQGLQSTVR